MIIYFSTSNRQLDPDMSIWEVRNNKQNFVYSKIMLWVAFDRGIRLAEKRCLPCPNRAAWMKARDEIYEEIMNKGNGVGEFFFYYAEAL
jgi:GH15 family glucan-1,4-alpha-glucosidase